MAPITHKSYAWKSTHYKNGRERDKGLVILVGCSINLTFFAIWTDRQTCTYMPWCWTFFSLFIKRPFCILNIITILYGSMVHNHFIYYTIIIFNSVGNSFDCFKIAAWSSGWCRNKKYECFCDALTSMQQITDECFMPISGFLCMCQPWSLH